MRIGIDTRLYGTKHAGLGRYIQELIKNLELSDQTNEYFIFLAANNFDDYQPQNSRFKKIRADYKVYGLFEQLLFPFQLYKYNLQLVHFPHFNVPLLYAKKYIVTIHDLIISHYPSSRATTLSPALYRIKIFFYNLIVSSAARRAKKIIAVSKFTKNDIVRFLKVNSDKVAVVYEGVDLPPENNSDCKILADMAIGSQYLLYVGAAYPHKNLEKLIEAFRLLKNDFPLLQLVLAGKNNFFYERLKKWTKSEDQTESIEGAENFTENIIFTGYVSDNDLACLYQHASLYIFPSLLEGFGLPPLEAQSYGLPVVSANSSCLPEVLGESATYFDPNNVMDIAEKIKTTLNDEELRQKLAAAGKDNLKKYSWAKMAEEIKALYKL